MTTTTRLAALGAATAFETAGQVGGLPSRLSRIAGCPFAGPARTARVPTGENPALHQMLPTLAPTRCWWSMAPAEERAALESAPIDDLRRGRAITLDALGLREVVPGE